MTLEHLGGDFLMVVLAHATGWLVVGLLAARLLARRPGRAHAVLVITMTAAAAAPIVDGASRLLGWGLLPAPTLTSSATAAPALGPVVDVEVGWWETLTWFHAIAAVWLLAATIAAARLGVGVFRGLRLVRQARVSDDVRLRAAADSAADRLGMHSPRLLESDEVRCPVICCWGAPRVIVPSAMSSSDDALDVEGVLCHELAHLRRGDHWAQLLAGLVTVVLPWHPLAWIARARLTQLGEEACDAWSVATCGSPARYAETLLNFAPYRHSTTALASVGSRHSLSRRITRILDGRTEPGVGLVAVTLAACVVLGAATTAALAHPRRATIAPTTNASPPAALEHDDVYAVRVSPAEIDLGTVEPGETALTTAWLVNTAQHPIEVLGAKPTCGCVDLVDFEPVVVGAGESHPFDLTMKASPDPGEAKTKVIVFTVDGQPPLRVPVHIRSAE